MQNYKLLLLILIPLLITSYVKASTYLDVGDDVYDILHRLEAEGVIQSALLTTKPLSRKEIVRLILEAENNSEGRSALIRHQIQWLKDKFKGDFDNTKYIKPVKEVSATYIHADKQPSELSVNNDGDDYDDGSNFRLGLSSRADLGWLSLNVNPEVRYSDSDTDFELVKAYGVLDFLGMEIEIGKDSQWWGPGYHGAILLTNNPEPLTMVKFTNSRPILLPWIFERLGLFKFTAFMTRLEEDRIVPEPYMWGMRVNLKPSPFFEIGLHRTALLGGEGHSADFSTWVDSLLGRGENDDPDDPGDQRAGYDIKLTMPFDLQPLQLYVDAVGEDEAGGFPSNWAYMYGLYLPRILELEKIGLRAEYVDNHISGKPNAWYTHKIYQSGYTYKGRIIGHHMGTDSKDMFVEVSYFIPELNGKLSIAYDRKEHNRSEDIREEKQEIYLKAYMNLTECLRINTGYGYGKIENINNTSGDDDNINTFLVELIYEF